MDLAKNFEEINENAAIKLYIFSNMFYNEMPL